MDKQSTMDHENSGGGERQLRSLGAVRACLFDLDGVLVYTDRYHYQAWKSIADENGWDFNEAVNDRLRGIPRLESLNEILKYNHTDISDAEKARLTDLKNASYVELLAGIGESDACPGAFDFVRRLRKRGIGIALCSSSRNAGLVLEKLGVGALFDTVVTGNDIRHAKPNPEIFITAAKRLGVPFSACVVFEDSLAGIQGAIAAGMQTVGVGNRAELGGIAGICIDSYDELDPEEWPSFSRTKI